MLKLTNHEGGGNVWIRADRIAIVQQHDTHSSVQVGITWIDVKEPADDILAVLDLLATRCSPTS